MSCGKYCGPSCAIPSCASAPVVPLGPCGAGYGIGGGYGGGYGLGYGGGGAVSSSSLGILAGANVSCINQIPPSEVVIQPAPVVLTVPGPILSASCEPIAVGGYTPCASGYGGYGGYGSYGGYGYGGYGCGYGGYLGGGLKGICRPKRKYSI